MYFLANTFSLKPLGVFAGTNLGNIIWRVLGNDEGQIIYFLVNAFPPKPLDVASSDFADA